MEARRFVTRDGLAIGVAATVPVAVKSFRISVYRWNAKVEKDAPLATRTGTDWNEAWWVEAPGFNEACSIDLRDDWPAILEAKTAHSVLKRTGQETILKFGSLMTWKEDFLVVIDVDF